MTENKRTILLKYGELILKGQNKRFFEDQLIGSIKKRLSRIGNFSVYYSQSTIYVDSEDDSLLETAFEKLKKVFGIVSLCIAWRAQKNIDDIIDVIKSKIAPSLKPYKTFKTDARRSDKAFPLKSPEIMALAGGAVLEVCPDIKVDVHNPEITVMIEIRENASYIHAGSSKGAGGMPQFSSSKALLLLSGGIDSPVAGYMMAKRGAKIRALHFESYPYTSERAKNKVITLAEKLCDYVDDIDLHFLSLTDIQLKIKENCKEEYFTLILRRFMMRLACRIAEKTGCEALITGESLGQVASQTMGALAVTDKVCTMPVLRPLIGMDKEEIVTIARNIDTFETSILPYEDCCTVFTPRHPKLKPQLDKLIKEENKLDLETLITEAEKTLEHMRLGL